MWDRLKQFLQERGYAAGTSETPTPTIKIAFVEGFLLYAPPPSMSSSHPLRPIHSKIDVSLFLPATYSLVKERREGRSGYVTIGPPPTPSAKAENDGEKGDAGKEADTNDKAEENYEEELPSQNFWEDPPGYVDDIVWPHYIQDHVWLLKLDSEGDVGDEGERKAKEGGNARTDVGVSVAPGKGEASIAQMLEWSVGEVIRGIEGWVPRS